MPQWFVSDHAVERYRHRIDPRASEEQARVILERNVLQSARLKGKTRDGKWRYLLPNPTCIAVVEYDGKTNVVKTILSASGDQGRKWVEASEPIVNVEWKQPNHPDWLTLRAEYRHEFAMALLRLAAKSNVQEAIRAWLR